MRPYLSVSLSLGVVLWLTAVGCERQPPPPKPVGAATNKHVEETPAPPSRAGTDAMQHMKTPMDDARQTEDLLKGAADRTSRQLDEPTP